MFGIGRYNVQVLKTALSESKEKGTPQITVQFEGLPDTPNAGDVITAYLYCSENAWPHTEKKLATLGWDPAKNSYDFEALNADPSPIAGHKVEITTKEEEWDGEKDIRVNFINPLGGNVERMSGDKAKSFADQLRARILGNSNGSAKRAAGDGPAPTW